VVSSEVCMRHNHTTEVLFHQLLVDIGHSTCLGAERIVAITTKDQDLTRHERPYPVSKLVIVGLDLAFQTNLTIAWQLRVHAAVFTLMMNLRLESFRHRIVLEAGLHHVLLKLRCFAQEGSRLTLYDCKLVNLLVFTD
jgi:hypothetical protein